MHHFKTVPHVMIENGGSHKLAALLDQDALPHKVFVVTDNGLQKLGLLDPALASLHEAGIETMVFDRVLADPPQEIVLAGADQARRFGADMILGFGGGSPMDTAKVISALVGSDQPIETMYGVGLVKGPRLPLMLIPTTAGTGSEVTNVAILTTGKTEKQGIVSDALYADRVLLDAGLTLGLPKSITVATGIDAMVHAIEAYTSLPQKNPLSDTLALSALVKLKGAIEIVAEDGAHYTAREQMMIGSMLAGQAFSNAPCAAVHALAYPLGGFFHVPHGLSNALVLTEVLKYNLPKAKDYYAQIADALGLGASAHKLIDEMQRIKDATGVPQTLRAVDISPDAIPMMAKDAMTKTRLLVNNPRQMSYDAVCEIYEAIAK